MAIVVETGSGLNAAANSYVSVVDLRTFASLRGIDLTSKTDTECASLLIRAMDYIEAQRGRFKGDPAHPGVQPLQWPRANAWDISFRGALFPSTEIPRELIYAQMQLALDAIDNDLMPNRLPADKGPVIREKVDVIEVAYENTGRQSRIPAFAKAEALLAHLYKNSGLTLVRS